MKTSKIVSLVISLVLLFSSLSFITAFAEDIPHRITRKTPQIGSKSSNLIYVKTGNGISGEITIGTGKFYTVDKAQNHIYRKNSKAGKAVLTSVNGGYFDAYTTGFQTYAAIVQDGVLVDGGGSSDKPTLGFTSTSKAMIGRVKLQAQVLLRSTVPIRKD